MQLMSEWSGHYRVKRKGQNQGHVPPLSPFNTDLRWLQLYFAPILFLALQSHLCSFRLRFSSSCKTFLSCRKSWCFSSCRAKSFSCNFRIWEKGTEDEGRRAKGKRWNRSRDYILVLWSPLVTFSLPSPFSFFSPALPSSSVPSSCPPLLPLEEELSKIESGMVDKIISVKRPKTSKNVVIPVLLYVLDNGSFPLERISLPSLQLGTGRRKFH